MDIPLNSVLIARFIMLKLRIKIIDWVHSTSLFSSSSYIVASASFILAVGILPASGTSVASAVNKSESSALAGPGQVFDLQAFIDKQIASGENEIVIPPGRHRIEPDQGVHLRLAGLRDVVIDGRGAELICTDLTRAIHVEDCYNVTLRGFAVDYDPMAFTQGVIVGLSDDKFRHEIELLEGYPGSEAAADKKYEIYDATTRELASMTYHNVKLEVTGPRSIVLTKPARYITAPPTEEVGDRIVIATKGSEVEYLPHTIYIEKSEKITLEAVTVYASPSHTFGFFELDSSESRYIRCRVDRRPLNEEWRPLAEPRLRSLNADAYHSKRARIGPLYDSCLGRFMADDGIAINGDYQWIASAEGRRLKVAAKWGSYVPLEAGDSVELVSRNGLRLEDAKVVAVERENAPFTDEEILLLNKIDMHSTTRERIAKTNATSTVVLDRTVELPNGSFIVNRAAMGNGFRVINCTIGPNRSRGILVKASDGLIQNNRLIGVRMEAIKVAPEVRWLEAGSSQDVTIVGNQIEGCHDAGIRVTSYVGNQLAPAGAIKEIRITENLISGSLLPAIVVTSTDGLLLEGNTIEYPQPLTPLPHRAKDYGRDNFPSREVYLEKNTRVSQR